MKALTWVNDPLAALHLHHSKRTDMGEVGYIEPHEAAESLLTMMDNDRKVASIVLSAALNHCLNNSKVRAWFEKGLKTKGGKI